MIRVWFWLSIALILPSPLIAAEADRVAPELRALVSSPAFGEDIPVIIHFADHIDPAAFAAFKERRERRHRVIAALKNKAEHKGRAALRTLLRARGARRIKNLWASGAVAARVSPIMLQELAQWPNVRAVTLDATVHAPVTDYGAATEAEWGLRAIRAHEVWGQGVTGQGVTIAILDTGVDVTHPELREQYRGGNNSWFDPYGQRASPYDPIGHGTSVAGIALGRNQSGSAIGVAPNAQWIAAKIFDDEGTATLSVIHQALQWVLDPDGDPATPDAPDVVNASWGLIGGSERCVLEFEQDLQTLKAAGMAVVFSAGNDGPGPESSVSPGNNSGRLSAGAIDESLTIADFSSRGPSACDGAVDPELSAPGVNVYSADTSFGQGAGVYAYVSGTSFAAPHVAGAIALLRSARPDLSVDEIEAALRESAQDRGAAGPDNDYGSGLLDVYAALQRLQADAPVAVTDNVSTIEDTAVVIDVLANDRDAQGDRLSVSTVSNPSARSGNVARNADQRVTYTPAANFVGTDSFTYTVTDGRNTSTGTVYVQVTPVNDAPTAADDDFAIHADADAPQYRVAAPGVLSNDGDVDGDALRAVLVEDVSHGSLSLAPDGGFSYTPPAAGLFPSTLSFAYAVTDGAATSSPARASFSINHGPSAQDDVFRITPQGGQHRVASPGVLANDQDRDGDAITAILVTNATVGSVSLSPSGGFAYTPPPGGVPAGEIQFTYQSSDGRAASRVATVSFIIDGNRAPIVQDDNLVLHAASASGPYTVSAPGVLVNDSDPDGDALTAALITNATVGDITLGADGAIAYRPAGTPPGGTLSFTYRASDGRGGSGTAQVQFLLNRVPVAVDDPGLVLQHAGERYSFSGSVLANDSDADHHALSALLVSDTAVGQVALTPAGSFTYTPPASGAPTGTLSFTYRVSDGYSSSGVASVHFTLPASAQPQTASPLVSGAPVAFYSPTTTASAASASSSWPNASAPSPVSESTGSRAYQEAAVPPPEPETLAIRRELAEDIEAIDDDWMLDEPNEQGQYVIDAPGVLENDRGEDLRAVLVRGVRAGKLKLLPSGGFVYTPPPGGVPAGPLSFTYKVKDDKRLSGEATVTLDLRTRLEPRPDTYILRQRDAQGAYTLARPGVLANDVLTKGARAVLVQNVSAGAIALQPDGGFSYRPSPDGAPKAPQSFSYRLVDGQTRSRTASVTFRVDELLARPDRLVLTQRDASGRFVLAAPGILGNDSASAAQPIVTRAVTEGRLTVHANGGLLYEPPPTEPPEVVVFRYRLSAGETNSNEAEVRLQIGEAPPTRSPDGRTKVGVTPGSH